MSLSQETEILTPRERHRSRRYHQSAFFIGLILTCVWMSASQGEGVIRGEVSAPDGRPVTNAPVELTNVATGTTVHTRTSADGRYLFEALTAGTYTLSLPADGPTLAAFEQGDVQVQIGPPVVVDVHLRWGNNLGTLGDDQSIFYAGLPDPPTGPAPRTAAGKPDFNGAWIGTAFQRPRGPDGRVEDAVPLPWADNVRKERLANNNKDSPSGFCLPSFPFPGGAFIFKIVQTDDAMVTLFENVPNYRQLFLDGRSHPKDTDPTWMGHSVGTWEGSTLVIDTVGFNDKGWIQVFPHTEKLHVVERYTRTDRGHLNVEVMVEDPETFVKPWRLQATWTLAPGQEVFEYVCAENNKLLQGTAK